MEIKWLEGNKVMSQARICDKCNKILKCSPSVKIWVDFHYNGAADYELCEECKQKLLEWLYNNKEIE